MSARVDAALTPTLPYARSTADATHEHGVVFSKAHSATGVLASGDAPGSVVLNRIPAEAKGRFWTFTTVGANVQIGIVRKGATTPTLVYAQLSAMGTGHAARGITLLDGTSQSYYVPTDAYDIAYVSASAAAGFFEAFISGAKTNLGS